MRNLIFLLGAGFGVCLLSSCSHTPVPGRYKAGPVVKGVAPIVSTSGNPEGPRGDAWFQHEKGYLRIAIRLEGLTPDAYHGIQLDALGGCSGGGPEGVYDPQGHYHAGAGRRYSASRKLG